MCLCVRRELHDLWNAARRCEVPYATRDLLLSFWQSSAIWTAVNSSFRTMPGQPLPSGADGPLAPLVMSKERGNVSEAEGSVLLQRTDISREPFPAEGRVAIIEFKGFGAEFRGLQCRIEFALGQHPAACLVH